jgi:hypothetical protein
MKISWTRTDAQGTTADDEDRARGSDALLTAPEPLDGLLLGALLVHRRCYGHRTRIRLGLVRDRLLRGCVPEVDGRGEARAEGVDGIVEAEDVFAVDAAVIGERDAVDVDRRRVGDARDGPGECDGVWGEARDVRVHGAVRVVCRCTVGRVVEEDVVQGDDWVTGWISSLIR